MKYLFDAWKSLERSIRDSGLILFLDYDGTLTPITEQPDEARLPDAIKEVLNALKLIRNLSLAVVSGRSLEQLRRFIGIPGIFYAGNHGFEIEGPNFKYVRPAAREAIEVIGKTAEALHSAFSGIDGIYLENKTLTLALHYRQVPESGINRVRTIFFKNIQPFIERGEIIFTEGKKVLEVRPAADWNKGSAVVWLYGRQAAADPSRKLLPIYIGDDWTDESALKALKKCGIGIKVADRPGESYADYYLRGPSDVCSFLNGVLKLKSGALGED